MPKIGEQNVLVGNEKLMEKQQIGFTKCKEIGTILYVAIEGKYVGYILIADKIKKDANHTIEQLKKK